MLNINVISNVRGLGAEVAKNVVLAGVGHVTLLDDREYDGDIRGNFLVPSDTPRGASMSEVCFFGSVRKIFRTFRQGLARCIPPSGGSQASAQSLQEMNPFIRVEGLRGRAGAGEHGADFLAKYDLVVLAGYSLLVCVRSGWRVEGPYPRGLPLLQDVARINEICRGLPKPVKLMAGLAHGPMGLLFADLQRHQWAPAKAGRG